MLTDDFFLIVLHDIHIIHTDLKPENIMLNSLDSQIFNYNEEIPSSDTTITRRVETQRRVLLDTEIRLIDFGSATFENEHHSHTVTTRHYRAPEIVMGLDWSHPCDIWSIGCILVELLTGFPLFPTVDPDSDTLGMMEADLEHLAMMEAAIGNCIDPYLIKKVKDGDKLSTSGGNPASQYVLFFSRLCMPTSYHQLANQLWF